MASLVVVLALLGLFGVSGDHGIAIDPNGVVRAVCSDEGSGLDPFGRPCSAQTLGGDEGHGIDPFG